jgi:hypothetical protein
LIQNGGRLLRQNISQKERKALEIKMGKVFNENMRMLSKEMKDILLDDLVTAFLNRLDVLARAENSEQQRNKAIHFSCGDFELIQSNPRRQG